MSRRRHGDTIKPWLSARVDCKEGRFIQVGNSLLLSKEFQSLTAGAQMMYLCMALESGGRMNFIFPQAAAKKYGFPPASMRRYIKELQEKNLISVQSMANLRQPNEYSFSLVWKQNKEPPTKP